MTLIAGCFMNIFSPRFISFLATNWMVHSVRYIRIAFLRCFSTHVAAQIHWTLATHCGYFFRTVSYMRIRTRWSGLSLKSWIKVILRQPYYYLSFIASRLTRRTKSTSQTFCTLTRKYLTMPKILTGIIC